MKTKLLSILLCSALACSAQNIAILIGGNPPPVGGSNVTADYWQDFEFTGTVNDAALNGSDHGASNLNTTADLSTVFSTTTGASMPMVSTVNSTADTGTRGLNMLCTAGAVATVTVPTTSVTNFTISFFYKTSTPAAFGQGPRFLRLQNVVAGEGDLIYLMDENDAGGGARQIHLRTSLGVSTKITGIANNTIYHITVNWIKNSASSSITVKTAAGSLVSTTNFTAANFNIDQFVYGAAIAFTGQSGINVFFDNILVRSSGTSSTDLGP